MIPHLDHRAVAIDGTLQQALDRSHLPAPPDQIGLSMPGSTMPFAHAQQPTDGHRFLGTFDAQQLRLSQHRPRGQPRGGLTEHHPTRWSNRLDPLSQSDLLTNRGVTQSTRTDFTGYHLTGIKAHAQLEVHTVALLDVDGKPLGFLLNPQGRETGTKGVVLQRHRRPEHRHDAVTGELVDYAAVPLHHRRAAVGEFCHDLPQSLSTNRRGDLHRVHHVGEQNGDLFVFRAGIVVIDW